MATTKVDRKTIEREVERWNAGLHKMSLTKAAEELGLTHSSLQRHLAAAKRMGLRVEGDAPSRKEDKGRSLDEFRAEHDKAFIVPKRVRAALEELGSGWLYEMEFAKLAGVSLADLGNFRSLFEDNIVAIRRDGGKRAWANKAVAAKMREMVS